jgi:copper chaperone for superoxide dismutase
MDFILFCKKKTFFPIFTWFVGKSLGAAVSALYSNMNRPLERRVHGLVRFIQTDEEQCIIEGTVDGLTPNSPARINIHEYGDLSNGCDRY